MAHVIEVRAVQQVGIRGLGSEARDNFSMDLISFGETIFVSLRVGVYAAYSEPFSSVIGREINFSLV